MQAFIERLKQRKLVQWAIAYVAFWFALLQGIDIVASRFDWPGSIERYFILALAIGFCVVLVLAWYHGERGAQRVGSVEIMILALLLAIGGVLIWHLGPTAVQSRHAQATRPAAIVTAAPAIERPAPAASRIAAFNPPPDTIVVLPFENLGGNKSQQYFSDGITEELTNSLGQNTGLRVIAWDTASKYRDSKQSATDIAKTLNVASVLTGKILRQGSEVRVIVELVDARSGYQTWSHHYDDSLSNIFRVQDKITASISDALKVKFASAHTLQTVNPEAHDLVLKARALMQTARTAAPYEQTRTLLEQAIAIAPDYADAHALLARALDDLIQFSTLSFKDALPKVRAEANEALQLDPGNVDAILALANADLSEGRNAEARKGFQHAIELDPSNATAHGDYALLLPLKPALAETLEAAQLDPDNATVQNNLATEYLDLGEYTQALAPSLALVRLSPHSVSSAFGLAQSYALLHRNQDAVKAFDLVHPDTPLDRQLAAAGKLAYQSVLDPKLRPRALAAADALRKRSDLAPDSLYNLFSVYLVLDKKHVALNLLDRSCAPTPFACNDFAVNPSYIPFRGDPRFEAMAKKYAASPQPAAAAAPASSPP